RPTATSWWSRPKRPRPRCSPTATATSTRASGPTPVPPSRWRTTTTAHSADPLISSRWADARGIHRKVGAPRIIHRHRALPRLGALRTTVLKIRLSGSVDSGRFGGHCWGDRGPLVGRSGATGGEIALLDSAISGRLEADSGVREVGRGGRDHDAAPRPRGAAETTGRCRDHGAWPKPRCSVETAAQRPRSASTCSRHNRGAPRPPCTHSGFGAPPLCRVSAAADWASAANLPPQTGPPGVVLPRRDHHRLGAAVAAAGGFSRRGPAPLPSGAEALT